MNSYHHQGIRRLAHRFEPMAYAEDGLVEGYFDPKADFLVGLQFHPERMLGGTRRKLAPLEGLRVRHSSRAPSVVI